MWGSSWQLRRTTVKQMFFSVFFFLFRRNLQDFADVNNIASTQTCYVSSSCTCCVPVSFFGHSLTLGNNHSHSNNPQRDDGLQAGTGAAECSKQDGSGIIELELGRSGPRFSQAKVWCPERDARNCKHVLLTIQLTSSLLSIVKACHVFLHWLWCRRA